MKGEIHIQNVLLKPLADQLKEVTAHFDQVSFTHVFQELNTEADALSREGRQLEAGVLILEESQDSVLTVSRQPV